MTDESEVLGIYGGPATEELINYIFRELPDEVVDQIDLARISPEGSGVARELITTGAVLTFASTLTVAIFRLVERWMEQQRQAKAMQLVYQASNENKEAMKTLAALEKKHAEVLVKYGAVRMPSLPGRKGS